MGQLCILILGSVKPVRRHLDTRCEVVCVLNISSPYVCMQGSDIYADPFYCNAEYLIDLKKISKPGDFLSLDNAEAVITRPSLMNETAGKVFSLQPWKSMKHGT